jgi:hypothetical protein
MPVSFKFESNSKDVNARLAAMTMKQIPYATVVSLTKTVKHLEKANVKDMQRIFNNPTPWTKKAFRTIPATVKPYVPVAELSRKDMGGAKSSNTTPNKQHYLEVQDKGGVRPPKAFERALRGRGRNAKKYLYATPTSQMGRNAYGNAKPSDIKTILNETSKKGGKFFIPKENHPLTLKSGEGVFERMKRGKVRKRMHLHTRTPTYGAKFRFGRRMRNYAKKVFPQVLRKEIKVALDKARFR